MKTLFVGGPNDGKRQELPNVQPHHYAYSFQSDLNNGYVNPCDSIGVTVHTYTRKQFRQAGKTFEVMFHSTIIDPMEALIKGYRYHRNPRK